MSTKIGPPPAESVRVTCRPPRPVSHHLNPDGRKVLRAVNRHAATQSEDGTACRPQYQLSGPQLDYHVVALLEMRFAPQGTRYGDLTSTAYAKTWHQSLPHANAHYHHSLQTDRCP